MPSVFLPFYRLIGIGQSEKIIAVFTNVPLFIADVTSFHDGTNVSTFRTANHCIILIAKRFKGKRQFKYKKIDLNKIFIFKIPKTIYR